jgi:serine/threonine protein kinase
MSLPPGTLIASRYEVVKCIGAGSMGLVYACRRRGEPGSGLVAVKVLFPEVSQDKTQLARFRNEVFAAYGVYHPNVVKVGEYSRDGDLVFYTMEFVSGGDLATKLSRSSERPTIPTVIKLLSQMCAGVQAIHDAGIIHRDLKPENIFLTKEGDVKIGDFGIARLEIGSARKLTEHGGVVGTIDYVAPEYLLSSQIDGRGDIYALGILGYEMIAGESPFKGDSIYDTMWKRIKYDPPPPSQIRPECPPSLDAIILKAMARTPEERFQTAQAMYDKLINLEGVVAGEERILATSAVTPDNSDQKQIAFTNDKELRISEIDSPQKKPIEAAKSEVFPVHEMGRVAPPLRIERPIGRPDPWMESSLSKKVPQTNTSEETRFNKLALGGHDKALANFPPPARQQQQLPARIMAKTARHDSAGNVDTDVSFLRYRNISVTSDDLLLLVLTMGVVVGIGLFFQAFGFYAPGR